MEPQTINYDAPIPPLPRALVPRPMTECAGCHETFYAQECIITQEGAAYCVPCHQRLRAPLRPETSPEERTRAERFRDVVRALGYHSAPTIADCCLGMAERFGGIEGFCDFYYGQISKAAEQAPGSSRVLAACAGVVKIIAASTLYQSQRPPTSGMSDQELAEEYQRAVKELLGKMPQEELLALVGEVRHEPVSA